MRVCGRYLTVLVLLCSLECVLCTLTLGEVTCGQKTCKLSQYCSEFDRTCKECKDICDSASNNYERDTCEKDCQVYIHDQRYVRVGDGPIGGGNENLRGTVQQLSRMVTVTLTLVCLMLLVLASVLVFQLYRWKVKKNITFTSLKNKILGKKSPDDTNPSKNNMPLPETKKNELRLEMPSTVTQSDDSPVTVTTSISRRPAEDSTLDYAYDNPAMSASPK